MGSKARCAVVAPSGREGRGMEVPHLLTGRGGEGEMYGGRRPVGFADPEFGTSGTESADPRAARVLGRHHENESQTERAERGVVERLRRTEVGDIDAEMVDQGARPPGFTRKAGTGGPSGPAFDAGPTRGTA